MGNIRIAYSHGRAFVGVEAIGQLGPIMRRLVRCILMACLNRGGKLKYNAGVLSCLQFKVVFLYCYVRHAFSGDIRFPHDGIGCLSI